MGSGMRTAVIFLVLLLPCVAFAQQDRCYPGLDCPGDIPRGGPPQTPKNSMDENPPPTRRQVPRPPPDSQQSLQQCADPYVSLMLSLFGKPPPNCTLPSTHCCFQNGSAVPLSNESTQVPFGGQCFQMYMGIPVQEGLGCRR